MIGRMNHGGNWKSFYFLFGRVCISNYYFYKFEI